MERAEELRAVHQVLCKNLVACWSWHRCCASALRPKNIWRCTSSLEGAGE